MYLAEYEKLSDIEKMRRAVNAFSYCNEAFLMRYNILELMLLHLAMVNCKWDFLPDQWTNRQVREALKGIVPCWDGNEMPVYKVLNK